MSDELRPNVFREVNERIAEITAGWVWDEKQGFLCECAADDCAQAIWLTRAEYEAIRADPAHFFALAGHERAEDERVVGGSDGYVVVERLAGAAEGSRVDRRLEKHEGYIVAEQS